MKRLKSSIPSPTLVTTRQFALVFLLSGIIISIYELLEHLENAISPPWLDHILTILFISITVSLFSFIVRKKHDEYRRKIKSMNDTVLKNHMKYRLLFENLPFGFQLNEIIFDHRGEPCDFRNLEVNKYYENISGTDSNLIKGLGMMEISPDKELSRKFIQTGITGEPFSAEFYSETFRKHLRVSVYSPEPGQFAVITEDITKRRQAEERQELLGKVLEILNEGNNWSNSLRDILHEIKSFSKFDAVGIRIENDNDYPYYAYEGFSEEFLSEENSICARLKDGSVKFDDDGRPVLECTCGMVISGKLPDESYITKKGSLWTNESKAFLDVPAEEEHRLTPRNTCIHHGYMSVLLVPLKLGNKIVGLLQMNNREPGKFTSEDIDFFEGLGHTISIAYGRVLNEIIIRNSRAEIARSEENLREAEKISRILLNASGSVNILINASDYSVIDINKAGSLLFGADSSEIRCRNAKKLFMLISNVFPEKLDEAVKGSKTVRFQEENSGKHFYNQIYPIKSESGEIQRLAVSVQDISEINQIKELRELNNELTELNATKDKLFSVLGHDLRSPVSGILNLAMLLDKNIRDYDPAKTSTFLKSILVTSHQILNLLDNLTMWARSRRGQIGYNPVFYSLSTIIKEITEVLQSAATSKKVSILSCISDDLIFYGDVNMINCILRNLVQNALKFTDAGGWVKIGSEVRPGIIEISVSDNGIGMNEELKQSLFKENAPVTAWGTSREKGSGLGLLLCREFVERHSGTISVESEPGKGSRFNVTLPLPEYTSGFSEKSGIFT